MESAHSIYEIIHLMFQIQKDVQYVKDTVRSLHQEQSQSLDEEWLNSRQVMSLLKITKVTLQKYRDEGILPYSQNGGKIYYKASDVSALLRSNYSNRPRKP